MKYSNIVGAWRTRYQALSHILGELVGGRLGAITAPKHQPWNEGCAYEAVINRQVKHCGVGCLFNDAQIRSIKSLGLNRDDIGEVSGHIGVKNLETVTGLSMSELQHIQNLHDMDWRTVQKDPKKSELYRYLKRELGKV